MVGKPVGAVLDKDSRVTRPDEAPGTLEQHRPAAADQAHATLVEIRPGNRSASTYTDVVGAVDTRTTTVEIQKQPVVTTALMNMRPFSRIAEKRKTAAGDLRARRRRV